MARDGAPHDAGNRSLVLFDRGDDVAVQQVTRASAFYWFRASHAGTGSLVWSEIVMNTQAQLQQAYEEAAGRHIPESQPS